MGTKQMARFLTSHGSKPTSSSPSAGSWGFLPGRFSWLNRGTKFRSFSRSGAGWPGLSDPNFFWQGKGMRELFDQLTAGQNTVRTADTFKLHCEEDFCKCHFSPQTTSYWNWSLVFRSHTNNGVSLWHSVAVFLYSKVNNPFHLSSFQGIVRWWYEWLIKAVDLLPSRQCGSFRGTVSDKDLYIISQVWNPMCVCVRGGMEYSDTFSTLISLHLKVSGPQTRISKPFLGKGSVSCTLLRKFTKESSLVQKAWLLTEV